MFFDKAGTKGEAMLHIINHYPIKSYELDRARSGDTVLFIENAVFELKKRRHSLCILKKQAMAHLNLCVRKQDLVRRGISSKEIGKRVAIIDDQDYQNVLEQNTIVKSWN